MKDFELRQETALSGLCKVKFFLKKSELTMEVGGWVQVSHGNFFIGKSSQNSPIPVLIFWSSIIYHLYSIVKSC